MSFAKTTAIFSGTALGVLLSVAIVSAWTGPGASPPSSNVSAPINVGSTAQVKNGDITTNSHVVYGDLRLNYGWNPSPSNITYLNFSNAQSPTAPTWGSSGYGIRDNNGTLEFKNSGGSWSSMQSTINSLAVSSQWTTGTSSAIYYNTGYVGIGIFAPSYALDVSGDTMVRGWLRTTGQQGWYSQTYGGGWYMTDSTWIRSYGSKAVYMASGLDTGVASGIGCTGGMGAGYMLRVCGSAAATSFVYSSDKRLKANIRPIDNALWKALQIEGVTFNWKSGEKAGQKDVGVIAQDVQEVLPEAVMENPETHMLSVDYPRLVPLLLSALKEQQSQIEALEKRIQQLEAHK